MAALSLHIVAGMRVNMGLAAMWEGHFFGFPWQDLMNGPGSSIGKSRHDGTG